MIKCEDIKVSCYPAINLQGYEVKGSLELTNLKIATNSEIEYSKENILEIRKSQVKEEIWDAIYGEIYKKLKLLSIELIDASFEDLTSFVDKMAKDLEYKEPTND